MKHIEVTRGMGKRILFVTVPADGHFNPLTGLAKHLQNQGYDVRWYTQDFYKAKLERLQIPFYPYVHAPQLNQINFENFYTERENQKSQVNKFRFDLEHIFIRPVTACMQDLEAIYKEFPFQMVIADIMVFSIPLIKQVFNVPVVSVGIIPLMESSSDLPPGGMGLTPANSFGGKLKHAFLRFASDAFIFKKQYKLYKKILASYGVNSTAGNIFDTLYKSSDLVLQSGTPGFEYNRKDLGSNIHFVGSLLPYTSGSFANWYDERLTQFKKIVLVTQGTVEKDVTKIIIPTLEAFKDDKDTLVVCTTGGSQTQQLQKQYAQQNVIIEDFIPFDDVMPFASVYVTNGGYGGVMLGIKHQLPLVVAGVHEGKNEICARVGYFNYGINLKTEVPGKMQLRTAVLEVINNKTYKRNVTRLANEFSQYKTADRCEQLIGDLLEPAFITKLKKAQLLTASN